jgi:hypothetical protein
MLGADLATGKIFLLYVYDHVQTDACYYVMYEHA